MNATEARLKATAAKDLADRVQYDEIMRDVEVSVKKGDFSLYYFGTLRPTIKSKLEQEGFIVGKPESDGRNEYQTEISW